MSRPRARDVGLSFGALRAGRRNSMGDVRGVKVGHTTIVRGSGPLKPGVGPVRTGVTAILPHAGNLYERPVKGAYFDFNGCGGLQGALQIHEFGIIDTPIALTNTMSMGTVADAVIKHMLRRNPEAGVSEDAIIPIVSECDDSFLNDARGLHVLEEHVFAAIDRAAEDVEEGAVGAGTGMVCYDFKGGIGTSSRVVDVDGEDYTVGALVLSNNGEREELTICGVPVGRHLKPPHERRQEHGSIVMVVGTDAPVNERQLGRIARRAVLGLATTGSCSHNGSGDIVISFSTANVHDRPGKEAVVAERILRDRLLSDLFRGTVDATAEAIINSLFKSERVEGRDGNVAEALPIDETLEILKAHRAL